MTTQWRARAFFVPVLGYTSMADRAGASQGALDGLF
ncbi:hypothetical protein EcE24377A_3319 [Escherichia coli O139:H28 str. E24377A]|uniref:Uncharacterized protein n=1 Tax=Escherichia coli O139:H28 (strain E24377A / ETEC) TaxID=331111 RepID=A7ZR97_ECO24|nr:hypothetical protein EcE24377A_3319 [Escherichia coli O139:H28 str. E24377A]